MSKKLYKLETSYGMAMVFADSPEEAFAILKNKEVDEAEGMSGLYLLIGKTPENFVEVLQTTGVVAYVLTDHA